VLLAAVEKKTEWKVGTARFKAWNLYQQVLVSLFDVGGALSYRAQGTSFALVWAADASRLPVLPLSDSVWSKTAASVGRL